MNKIALLRLVATLIFISLINQGCTTGPGALNSASTIETAFSPDGKSEALVVKVIQSAKKTIQLSAYSFTSPIVTQALINAKRRGVDVAIVVDHKGNITEDRRGKSHIALNLLANAGIAVRTNSRYRIHHDKFIIADELHVETGSFNYSYAAANYNSENVVVIWNNPQVAASYLAHWKNRYEQGIDYKPSE